MDVFPGRIVILRIFKVVCAVFTKFCRVGCKMLGSETRPGAMRERSAKEAMQISGVSFI